MAVRQCKSNVNKVGKCDKRHKTTDRRKTTETGLEDDGKRRKMTGRRRKLTENDGKRRKRTENDGNNSKGKSLYGAEDDGN